MNILEEIIAYKRKEILENKKLYSVEYLEKSDLFKRDIVSMKQALLGTDSTGIIAEFKRKSPSKGMINETANIEQVTSGFIKAGASALSILTDANYFGGSSEDLIKARRLSSCPVLRKEFIIDEYQIIEAKSIGADAILLIAACISKAEIAWFARLAKSLNLEILLELYEENELEKISYDVDLIGINNRNLKNFIVDIDHSLRLAALIPDNFIKVAESGIDSPVTIQNLKTKGFRGFIMGEYFMRASQPEKACAEFIKELRSPLYPPKGE